MIMANSFYKIIICSVLMLLSLEVVGQNKLSKEIKQTHFLSEDGHLFLDNKYGDILLNGWKKDSISITVNIETERKNIEDAKALLDRIHSHIKVISDQVIIKSEITKKETSFFNKYINKIDPFKNSKSSTSINYTIYLPESAEIEVNNKYGDIIIADWNGKLKANVEHGDIRIIDDVSSSNLSIKYGNLRANSLQKTSIVAKDASLSINNSNSLKLDSNGSEVSLETINNLELYSNKDIIEVSNLNAVFGSVKYSKVLLNEVLEKVNLDLNLAELRVLKFNNQSPMVNIDQKNSEVYINISEANFNFSANLEAGVLRIPKTMQNINSDIIDEKRKIRNVKASYGNFTKGVFMITGFKGIIVLKEL